MSRLCDQLIDHIYNLLLLIPWQGRHLLKHSCGTTASFAYDVFGRRVDKAVNGNARTLLYDGTDILQEIGDGATTASYLRSLSIDEPFVRQGSVDEYYHVDALGSPVALSNSAGAITTNYGYEPFGKTTVTGSSTNAFQFTGREQDSTGLYYYRARYYSPTLQRFISEDPIGFAGGDENFYAYTFNSPTNYTDPSGTVGLGGCLAGVVIDAALSGRKPTLASVAGSCALGAIGGQAAKAALTAAKSLLKSLANRSLLKAGQQLDRNGLTKAGRALQKHGDRSGSAFPKSTGTAAERNQQGQQTLSDILNSSNKTINRTPSGGKEIFDNNTGRGVGFNADGTMKGFLEP